MILALINGQDFGEISCVHGIKKLVKCICETNNKMIEFLQVI